MQTAQLTDLTPEASKSSSDPLQESIISFQAQIPLPLKKAMKTFIQTHPNWDQYRLIQAALAGFLLQNGFNSRSLTRLYIDNMFSSNSYRN